MPPTQVTIKTRPPNRFAFVQRCATVLLMPNTLNDLLTVREVMDKHNVHASTVIRWIRAGKFEARQMSDHPRAAYVIDRPSFERFEADYLAKKKTA